MDKEIEELLKEFIKRQREANRIQAAILMAVCLLVLVAIVVAKLT